MSSSSFNQLVLALNAGSSSLKASVLQGEVVLVSFLAERLNTVDAVLHVKEDSEKKNTIDAVEEKKNGGSFGHAEALGMIIEYLKSHHMLSSLVAVGHRVVHGGNLFSDSAIVTDESFKKMESVSHLAPLHNPHNLAGIKAMRTILKENDVPNVAVFDTSFHASIPSMAYTYPLPKEYRELGIRKYGFHGTSVKYVSQKANDLLLQKKLSSTSTSSSDNGDLQQQKDEPLQMIVCHLGNGASVTAVSGMTSKDTSMGFTPLSGLMMGTRCGDIDASIVQFVSHQLNKSIDDISIDLNKQSGLKGMMSTSSTSDMREILKQATGNAKNGDDGEDTTYDKDLQQKQQQIIEDAQLTIDMFVYRLVQHIAQSIVALDGPMDAIVFTAGIGEHSYEIRQRTIDLLCKSLFASPSSSSPSKSFLQLDKERNENNGKYTNGIISKDGTWPIILVIPTDEEVMIAKECLRLISC